MSIYIWGNLRKEFGPVIESDVHSVAELMKAAEAMRPGFKDKIKKDQKYVIRRGSNFRQAKDVDEKELEFKFSDTDWHILPMPAGCGGAVKVVLGAVLLVVSYVFPVTAPYLAPLGVGLILGGVAELLSPMPPTQYDNRDNADERPSFLFDGPTNRVAPGGAVPLVYGFNVFIGSIFLSGGLEVGDIALSSPTTNITVSTPFGWNYEDWR